MIAEKSLARKEPAEIIERVIAMGDLSALNPEQRTGYYKAVCESIGLNPLTKPFEYLLLNDKLVLYARKDATDQLRKIHGVSVVIKAREIVSDVVFVVTVQASTPDGRTDEAIGAVPLVKENGEWREARHGKRYFAGDGTFRPLNPDDRANAIMKAETKAKRRVTLSICGLGILDESELDTMRGAIRSLAAEQADEEPGEVETITVPEAPEPPKRAKPRGKAGQILALAAALKLSDAQLIAEVFGRFKISLESIGAIEALEAMQRQELIEALKAELSARAKTRA